MFVIGSSAILKGKFVIGRKGQGKCPPAPHAACYCYGNGGRLITVIHHVVEAKPVDL
jgi:hypothetical protein